MRQVLTLAVFMLATLTWTMAQQSGAGSGQATSPSSQTPGASQQQPPQSQPSAPGSTRQSPAPNSQTPSADQSQPSQSQPPSAGSSTNQGGRSPGSTEQRPAQSPAEQQSQGRAANAPITEGCLGGSNPNFTITDQAGTTYKLNIPQGADVSVLTPHVGESVQVMGQVTNGGGAGKASAIDVTRIGRGQGGCPADKSKQPKQ